MISKESKNVSRVRRHARVRAKVSGTAACPRLCVYRSNKNIEAQLIDDLTLLVKLAKISLKKQKQRKSRKWSSTVPDIFITDVLRPLQKPLEKPA